MPDMKDSKTKHFASPQTTRVHPRRNLVMNARIFSLASVALLLGSLSMSASAQDRVMALTLDDESEVQVVGPVMPVIAPDREVPRLGFEGRIVGSGLRIERVFYGTLAYDAGLERGDVIREINGRHIDSVFEYQQALLDAQDFRDGRVRLLIDNVRWHRGESSQRWVTRTIFLPVICSDGGFSPGGTFGG